jgi:hypothetical protein
MKRNTTHLRFRGRSIAAARSPTARRRDRGRWSDIHSHHEAKLQEKRVALVTGASQGIGLQIAKDLAAHGFTVLVGSRNPGRGEAAAREVGPEAHAILLDVTDRDSIAVAVD